MTPGSTGPVVRMVDLHFSYRETEPIIRELNIELGRGETVALTGPSGRGKSTLLYLIGLLLTPQRGELWVGGKDVTRLPDRERAKLRSTSLGFVFQDAQLDPTRTVLDNVIEGARYRGDDLTVARDRAEHLLQRFEVRVDPGRRPGQISGGQAQRIALARALLGRPPILLADEPTGNLDAGSARLVLDAFHAHAQSGGLVLIATHDPVVLDHCDREIAL